MEEKVIIIGGGPTGLAASIYNARADLHPLVVAGSPPGGQLMLTSEVENYPGFASILGPDLVVKMRKQAEQFGVRLIDENVSSVNFSRKPFTIIAGNKSYQTETVLIATGANALWLNLESEQRLRGKGVSACATCDGFFFRDKVVGVVGGGDTAMEEALTLTKFAKKVYIIHRRSEFRASKIMQKRVFDNKKIEIIWNATVEEVLGSEKVEGVKLKINPKSEAPNPKQIQNSNNQISKQSQILPLDGLFIAIGHRPATEFLKGSGVMLDERGYVVTSGSYAFEQVKSQKSKVKSTSQNSELKNTEYSILNTGYDFSYQYATSIPGVFAAGDVIDPIYRQAATAVGMGVAAALEIEKYLSL